MTRLRGRRRLRVGSVAALAVGALALGAAACAAGPPTPATPESSPPPRTAPPTSVDVCELLPASRVSEVLDVPVRVVGRTVSPARLPTAGCELGDRVDDVLVAVTLEATAIAAQVFDEAYGDAIGGDPMPVRDLGDRAYLRTENASQSLHVYVHGGVVSVRASLSPFGSRGPVRQAELLELAEAAVAAVPPSPRLEVLDTSARCGSVPEAAVRRAIGRDPTLASGADSPAGTVCSWGAQPGAATVRVSADAETVEHYSSLVRSGDYSRVADGIDVPGEPRGGPGAVQAWSTRNRPGDLVLLHGRSVAVLMVVPAAGFAEADLPPTPGERELAAAVVLLMR